MLNALDSITANENNPYLIKLGPGIYDLGSEHLVMNDFVSIEGSGEKATKITAAASTSADPPDIATVMGANNVELRELTNQPNSHFFLIKARGSKRDPHFLRS